MICRYTRILGIFILLSLPDVSTISRPLSQVEADSVKKVRKLSRAMVIEGLKEESLGRLTFDFDSSVQSTKRHTEGTAVGFNKKKKGARSYYPLFCTVAQTNQFFDGYHRPGNVHDSNGTDQFMLDCFRQAKQELKNVVFESHMDSAFFSDKTLNIMGPTT